MGSRAEINTELGRASRALASAAALRRAPLKQPRQTVETKSLSVKLEIFDICERIYHRNFPASDRELSLVLK
ncbi:hypothetical protein GN956_G18756 [Arapaima gigas]